MANRFFYGKAKTPRSKQIDRIAKRQEAFQRQLRLWNDGTGFIYRNAINPIPNNYKRVCNPLAMLKKSEREGVTVNDWRDRASA